MTFDADAFEEGTFAHRRRGHVDLAVVVWFGPPVDVEGESDVLDRAPRWQVALDGKVLDDERVTDAVATLAEVWPQAKAVPISEDEYQFLLARREHAREHAPHSPFAHRRGRIDPLTAELLF